MTGHVNEPAPGSFGEGRETGEETGGYTPREWERVVDGVLEGPGYAFDLETGDLLCFVSPGLMLRLAQRPPREGTDCEETA